MNKMFVMLVRGGRSLVDHWIISLVIMLAILPLLWAVWHLSFLDHIASDYRAPESIPEEANGKRGWVLADTLAGLLEHELSSPLGWQDNDILCLREHSRFCLLGDDNRNRQLGVVVVIREALMGARQQLTRDSSSTAEEALLARADTALRNDTAVWMFPSFESKIRETIEALRTYQRAVALGSAKQFSDNLSHLSKVLLLLDNKLGQYHGSLAPANLEVGLLDSQHRPVGWLLRDNIFYEGQGQVCSELFSVKFIRNNLNLSTSDWGNSKR